MIFLLLSCNDHKSPEYVSEAKKIMKQFCKDMYKSKGYTCIVEGGGFMHNINNIHLGFRTFGPKSQEELRIAMVDMVQDFLKRVNEDEKIREHLSNYPFLPTNLEFSLCLEGRDGKSIKNKGKESRELYGIFLIQGKLIYVFQNEDKYPLQKLYEESFDEAEKVLTRN